MPTGIDRSDSTFEAQVIWIRYRKEFVALLAFAILAMIAFGGYQFYRERREAAASTVMGAARTSSDFQAVIDHYSDTAAAADAYLLLADEQRKNAKFTEANTSLHRFIERFPQHQLVSTARMAMAANLESMGKHDEAFVIYQQIASANSTSFNAPFALLAQVQILQVKGRLDDARRTCETILTRYRESYAAMEAMRLLRTLKPASNAPTGGPATPSPAPAATP